MSGERHYIVYPDRIVSRPDAKKRHPDIPEGRWLIMSMKEPRRPIAGKWNGEDDRLSIYGCVSEPQWNENANTNIKASDLIQKLTGHRINVHGPCGIDFMYPRGNEDQLMGH